MASRIEDEIDPGTIAAEVLMLRAASNNTILILEGPSDEKVFINFIDTSLCEIVIAHGKYNAVEALNLLKGRSLTGLLCIVDEDFDQLFGKPSRANVLRTDDHDLETMIFRSSAFDRVLYEFGSATKIANSRSKWTDLRDPIVQAAYPVGLLRLYSLKNSTHLTFDGVRPAYVDRRTLVADITLMIKTVTDHSRVSVDIEEVYNFFGKWPMANYDPWQICCGHDLAEIFGKSLQTLFGSRRSIEVDLSSIERALRLSYSMDDFRLTNLFSLIKDWEQNNARVCLRL